tara:strand:- start:13690 stop:14334 length:645 start_codon:yes stop_codon:yes gene_type:complete
MTFRTKTIGLAAILATSVSGAAIAQNAGIGGGAGVSAGVSAGTSGSGISAGTSVDANGAAQVASDDSAATQGGALNGNAQINGNTQGNAIGQQPSGADVADARDGSMKRPMTYGQVISSVRTQTNADAVGQIDAGAEIETMTLSEVQGEASENASALDTALTQAETELTDMRGMIGANADLSAALNAEGYAADDVIGVYETTNGSFQVLIDDRS